MTNRRRHCNLEIKNLSHISGRSAPVAITDKLADNHDLEMARKRRRDSFNLCQSPTMHRMRQRKKSVNHFKMVVKYMDGVRHRKPPIYFESSTSGLLDIISDDCVAEILKSVLFIPCGRIGNSYLHKVDETVTSFCGMMLSCTRICNLIRGSLNALHAEALARASTVIIPRTPFAQNAFTVQMSDELASCDHLKMLRSAQRAIACHCAGQCCERYRRYFNKELRNGEVFSRPPSPTLKSASPENSRIVSAMESCTLIAVQHSGSSAFAHVRERVSKKVVSNSEGRGRRFKETIVLVEEVKSNGGVPSFVKSAKLCIDEDDMSLPISMCCSPSGKSVVFTRSEHDVDPNSTSAFGCAFLWCVGHPSVKIEPPDGCAPGIPVQSLSAQDCWFTDVQGDEALVVAWSTDFVHSSGHHIGSHSNSEGPMYFFATYIIEKGKLDFFEATFAEKGCLLDCSPSENGTRVVTLDKARGHDRPSKREVHVHDIRSGMCKSVLTGPIVSLKGPVCASLSPSGDAVVAVHKTGSQIAVTVNVVNDEGTFTPVQMADVSTYLSLQANENEAEFYPDLGERSISVKFSPCSRFAALVDRQPFFGRAAVNHGVVVLDMALRMSQSTSLRPFPMFPTRDQAPRDFQWSRRGIWLLPPGTDDNGSIGPRGGALCLLAPPWSNNNDMA
jgi:hypothetical protein